MFSDGGHFRDTAVGKSSCRRLQKLQQGVQDHPLEKGKKKKEEVVSNWNEP